MRAHHASGPVELVGSRPGGRELSSWWRRGDSTFRSFRYGLDYAFIRGSPAGEPKDAERVIRAASRPSQILVPTPGSSRAAVGESMSLYRAGLKLAFFLPLGVAMPLPKERRQVSPM